MHIDSSNTNAIARFEDEIDWTHDAAAIAERIEALAPTVLLHPEIAALATRLPAITAVAAIGRPYTQLLQWEVTVQSMGHPSVDLGLLETAEQTFRELANDHGLGVTKALLGTRYLFTNEVQKVGPTLEESRRLLGDASPHLEPLLANSSWSPYIQGDLGAANLLAEQAISQARVRGNDYGEGVGWFHVGFFAVWRGDFNHAQAAFRSSIHALDDNSELFETPMAHTGLGLVSAARGRFAEAEAHFQRAFAAAEDNPGFRPWLRASISAIHAEYFASVDPQHCLNEARTAQRDLVEQHDDWWARWALRSAAQALAASGQREAARNCLEELVVTEPHVLELAHATYLLGDLLHATDRTRAESLLRQALDAFSRAGAHLRIVQTAVSLLRLRPKDARHIRALALAASAHDRAYDRAWRGGTILDVRVLGNTTALLDGKPIAFPTIQAEEAFYALVTEPNLSLNVETLAARVWPDASPARINQRINTLVWQLRTCLGRAGERIQRHRNLIVLNLDNDECDLRRHLSNEFHLGGPSDQRRQPREQPPTASERAELARPVLPRFSTREWVIDLQHRIDASRIGS